MNYGLYLSASGVLTQMYRQDVLANNLANVHTTGYKPDRTTVRQRSPESLEDQGAAGGGEFRQALLDRLGGGVLAGPQGLDLTPGSLKSTGNDLDVALTDSDSFLAVQSKDPLTGKTLVRLTRDGRLSIRDGQLSLATDGSAVLDDQDNPIALSANQPVQIDEYGQIHQNGAVVARLQIATPSDASKLVKTGGNRYWFADGRDGRIATTGSGLQSGHLESSGVDPVMAMVQLMDVGRAIESNANMIRYQDQIMSRAVNVLGKASA